MKRTWTGTYQSQTPLWVYLPLWGLALVLLIACFNAQAAGIGISCETPLTIFAGLGTVGFLVTLLLSYRRRPGQLELSGGMLTLKRGRGRRSLHLAGAELRYGRYGLAASGALGTMAHLQGAGAILRVAGFDHFLDDGRYSEPMGRKFDLGLPAEAFIELCAVLERELGLDAAQAGGPYRSPGQAGPGPLILELPESPAAPRRVWMPILLWMGGITVVLPAIVIAGQELLPQTALTGVAVTLVAGLLVTVIALASRRTRDLRLAVEDDALHFYRAKTGELQASLDRRSLQAELLDQRVSGRYLQRVGPALRLRPPGLGRLTIGTMNPALRWQRATGKVSAVQHLLSPHDWDRLVKALGLQDELETA